MNEAGFHRTTLVGFVTTFPMSSIFAEADDVQRECLWQC